MFGLQGENFYAAYVAAQEGLVALEMQAKQAATDTANRLSLMPIVKVGSVMDAGAGSGAIGRFAVLEGESLGGKQAYQDALRLTGLPVDIDIVGKELPVFIPMRYSLSDHLIEVNSLIAGSRSIRAQEMAEELLHATDHVGNHHTLSAASALFDMPKGVLMLELRQHYNHNGHFKEFFDYPLHVDNRFKDDRIKTEVFARLGVLYFANPDELKRELPTAYEVYHELFGLSRYSPVSDEYIRSKIWTAARGSTQDGMQSPAEQKYGIDHAGSLREESARELGRLRNTIAKVLKASELGKKADL